MYKPAPQNRVTFSQFMEWNTDETWAEWVDGFIRQFPAFSSDDRLLSGFLANLMQTSLESRDCAASVLPLFLMRCRPDGNARLPDLLYVSPDRTLPSDAYFLDGPADLVIEIVSPESVRRDHVEKFAEYEAGGVGEYWIIDPTTQTAEFYIRDAGAKHFRRAPLEGLTEENGGVYTCEMLGGLRIDVDWLWQRPLPSLLPIVTGWGLLTHGQFG
ncbi:MAG: Uma2 family endonuclease [Akkermansiaceae bacterium]|nr:Uma2 family endonuclease [Armatimonadota bacterium]